MYALVAGVRPQSTLPGRVGRLPGDLSTHAFGKVNVRFTNGASSQVHFFVSQLEYSRWAEVSTVERRMVEPLLRGLVEHFSRLGGVPLVAAFEPGNVAGIATDLEGPWDPAFAQAILDLGVGLEWLPRRLQCGREGPVERLLAWVKRSFFRTRRFACHQDLQARLIEWRDHANARASRRTNGVAPQARMVEERARLRALTFRAEDFALRIPVVVGPGPAVAYEGGLYPMPQETLGRPAVLHLHAKRVRIAAGSVVVEHPRRLTMRSEFSE